MNPAPHTAVPRALAGRHPVVPTERLLADLVPPRHFADAQFETYIADPAHPSQGAARTRLEHAAGAIRASGPGRGAESGGRRRWAGFGMRKATTPPLAFYLDGGFGVGKTHLLAALSHAVGDCAYGTFVEFTNLVGALGFRATVEALGARRLVCIDEFELDDPGDTVLMSRLLRELADRGVAIAATSNTLPEALGEGRFAAEDFMREIQALAARFEVLRIDGRDYRNRDTITDSAPIPSGVLRAVADATPAATVDDFDALLSHLALLHPSKYGALLDGVTLAAIDAMHPVAQQESAPRLVVLIDRLYDRDIPVLLGGTGEHDLFPAELLRGGYRKKYFRALSRLGALAEEGRRIAAE